MTSQAAHKVGLLAAAHTGVASLILYGATKISGCGRPEAYFDIPKKENAARKQLLHGDKYTMELVLKDSTTKANGAPKPLVGWSVILTENNTGSTFCKYFAYNQPDKYKERVKKLASLPPDQLYLQGNGRSYSIHNETVKLGDFYEVKEPSWSGYLYHLPGSLAHISATTLFGYRTAKKSFLSHADTLFKAPNIAPFMIFSYLQCLKITTAAAMLSPFFHMWPHWSRYFDPYQPNYWDNGERKWPTVTWDAVFLNHGYSFVVLIPFLTVASVIVTAAASPMAVWYGFQVRQVVRKAGFGKQ